MSVTSRFRKIARALGWTSAGLALFASTSTVGAVGREVSTVVKTPMHCSRGSDPQYFLARVHAPPAAMAGSVYTVRIDSYSSSKLDNFGLNYVYGIQTEYSLPDGLAFVPNSARIVPDTGTENVRPSARTFTEGNRVREELPDRVESGSSYTPPSIEFEVKVTAPEGTSLPLQFVEHRISANVLLLGDVHVICNPNPAPFTIATTRVIASATARRP